MDCLARRVFSHLSKILVPLTILAQPALAQPRILSQSSPLTSVPARVTDTPGVVSMASLPAGDDERRYYQSSTPLGQPNLRPYKPSSWSAPIVVSLEEGTNTDSPFFPYFRTSDTLYIDFAVVNDGDAMADEFFVTLSLDTQLLGTFRVPLHLLPGYYAYSEDIEVGPLPEGVHTLEIEADSTKVIPEISEIDNRYSRKITVQSVDVGKPNLRPATPSGWSAPLVLSRVTGTNTDANPPVYSHERLYLDFAVLNSGEAATSASYLIALFLDDQLLNSWSSNPPHEPNYFRIASDWEISLPAGTHSLRLVSDSSNVISESNESDNTYTKTIEILDEGSPNLKPYQPVGWSAPIVVSNVPGTHQDSVDLVNTDLLYVDLAVMNDGNRDATLSYNVTLSVDGQPHHTFNVSPPHLKDTVYTKEDIQIGPLSGSNPSFLQNATTTYTFSLSVDTTQRISESNESDNSYSRSVTMGTGPPPLPDLEPFQPSGWPAPVVVSTEPGTHTDAVDLSSSDTLYIDWAAVNSGKAATAFRYSVELRLDGQVLNTWFSNPPHSAGSYGTVEDFTTGPLADGTYTLELVLDADAEVQESNEANNTYTRTLQVGEGEEKIFIVYPKIQDHPESSAGIAIANPTDQTAEVELYLVDDEGYIQSAPMMDNPASLSIAAHSQAARTLTQLFGSGASGREGWILAASGNLGIVGFFLTFSEDISRIDGAEAVVPSGSPMILFPEAVAAGSGFTNISLIGAGQVELHLLQGDDGIVETKTVDLPDDLGRFEGRLDEIFTSPITSDSCVVAESSESALIGYEDFGSSECLGGRNAIPVTGLGREIPLALFGAQLVDTADIQSTITLINPTDAAAQVTLSAFRSGVSSSLPVASRSAVLGSKSILKVDSRSFLQLPTSDFVGWLRLDSNIAGIVGDVTFGDPDGNFLSSVQLQEAPVRDYVFSHVADGFGYFTGLTFLNVSADPATVNLEVYSVNGARTGQATFVLSPFEHRPRLLSQIIPGFQDQVGGYIHVTSDAGIFSFELFAYTQGSRVQSMAAVPPQRGHGTIFGTALPVNPGSLQALTERTSSVYRSSASRGIFLDPDTDFIPGEIIVRLRPEAGPGVIRELTFENGLSVAVAGAEGLYLMRRADVSRQMGQSLESPQSSPDLAGAKLKTLETIESLNGNSAVLYAEPNYVNYPDKTPSDPAYQYQWHYEAIGLAEAWDITTGASNVIVAVIDSGAKFNHPDLASRLTGGQFDFVSDPSLALDGDGVDASAEDPGSDPLKVNSSFHGSHVAGTIAAVTNNDNGVAGVNWTSPLMVLRASGRGGAATDFDLAQAFLYAARLANATGRLPVRKASVINISMGKTTVSKTIQDVAAAAQAKNVVIVASAGNGDSDGPHYPCGYEGVICVGATDLSGERAPYSNFGPRIDVVAPGGNVNTDLNGDGYADGVLSTVWDEESNQPAYRFYQGTSMAAPHVTGVVSLMLSVNPDLTPAQVRQILSETAIDLGTPGKDPDFGYGLVDPLAALRAASTQPPSLPKLVLSTDRFAFGKSLQQATATISNGGGGVLRVDPPTIQTNQGYGWLSAALTGSTLTATVDRSGLAEGSYSGSIGLTSNGGSATIAVTMEVGGVPGTDIGTIFVLALSPTTLNTAGQDIADPDADYEFRIPPVPVGVYYVAAGTDLDEDGFICDSGEYCGFYPVRSQPALVRVFSNETTQISFSVEPDESPVDSDFYLPGQNFDGFGLREEDSLEKEFRRWCAEKIEASQAEMGSRPR